MAEIQQRKDVDRLSLSVNSRRILDELISDDFFKDGVDGIRMAVSYAITKKLDIKNYHITDRVAHDMYKVSQIDPDGIFGRVISEIYPEYELEKYRALEKFADFGLTLLSDEIAKNKSLIFWEE